MNKADSIKWYKVVFWCCKDIETFRYNKRVNDSPKTTQFINTETHEIVALWNDRIIRFEIG